MDQEESESEPDDEEESDHEDAGEEDVEEEDKDIDMEDGETNEEDQDTEVKAQDFHTMIATILEASGFLDLQRTGMLWDLVHKGLCYRDSHLKFVVPMIKCDTEEGDLNCGKYLSRMGNVKHGCRYCHCPMQQMDDPLAKHKVKTQAEIKSLVEAGDLEKLQAISQQHINNAWYKVLFHQANKQGIHGACPSEKLHATLLGIFKYVKGTLFDYIGAESKLADDVNGIAKRYGICFSHQSERDFPTTNLGNGLRGDDYGYPIPGSFAPHCCCT